MLLGPYDRLIILGVVCAERPDLVQHSGKPSDVEVVEAHHAALLQSWFECNDFYKLHEVS